MRLYILPAALFCLTQLPAFGQETLRTSGQSLQGTWRSGAARPDGSASTAEVGTYSADGSYIGNVSLQLHRRLRVLSRIVRAASFSATDSAKPRYRLTATCQTNGRTCVILCC